MRPVIEELVAWASASLVRPEAFFWRTQAGAGVDRGELDLPLQARPYRGVLGPGSNPTEAADVL